MGADEFFSFILYFWVDFINWLSIDFTVYVIRDVNFSVHGAM